MSRSGNVTVVSVTRAETRAASIAPLADGASGDKVALIEVDDVGVRGPSGTAGAVGPAGVTFISDTPPPNPTHGREWWQSNTGDHFIYYIDPSGPPGQWVQVNVASSPDWSFEMTSIEATVMAGASLTGVIDVGASGRLCAVVAPAVLTATVVSFAVATTAAGAYIPLHTADGVEYSAVIGVNRYTALEPAWLDGVRFVKIRLGVASAPATEAADRIFTLIYRASAS